MEDHKKIGSNTRANEADGTRNDEDHGADEVFIADNTNDTKTTAVDIVPAMEKYKVRCPRCRYIMQHAQLLARQISYAEDFFVKGICKHCQGRIKDQCPKIKEQFIHSKLKSRGKLLRQRKESQVLKDTKLAKSKLRDLSLFTKRRERRISALSRIDPKIRPLIPLFKSDEGSLTGVESPVKKVLIKESIEVIREPQHNSMFLDEDSDFHLEIKKTVDKELFETETKKEPSKLPKMKSIEKHMSTDSFLTSVLEAPENFPGKNFEYEFPKSIKKDLNQEQKGDSIRSSTELLKDIQQRLQIQAKEKKKKDEDLKNNNLEEKEKKRQAHIEKSEKTKALKGQQTKIDVSDSSTHGTSAKEGFNKKRTSDESLHKTKKKRLKDNEFNKSEEDLEHKKDKEGKSDRKKTLTAPGKGLDASEKQREEELSKAKGGKPGQGKVLSTPVKESIGKTEKKSDKEKEGKSDREKVLAAPGNLLLAFAPGLPSQGETEKRSDKEKELLAPRKVLPAPGKEREDELGKAKDGQQKKTGKNKEEKHDTAKEAKLGDKKIENDAVAGDGIKKNKSVRPDAAVIDRTKIKDEGVTDIKVGPRHKADEDKEAKQDLVDLNKMQVPVAADESLILKKIKSKHEEKPNVPKISDFTLPQAVPTRRRKEKKVGSESSLNSEHDQSLEERSPSIGEVVYMDKIFKRGKIPLAHGLSRTKERAADIVCNNIFTDGLIQHTVSQTPTVAESKKKLLSKDQPNDGILRYALSDRTFIDKGWTMLPIEKVVCKMNVYRMRPARPEFNWFEHNKKKGVVHYDSGQKLAEFKDNGRGQWFYRNGRVALDYYDAEDKNVEQRIVIYSNGELDERGRSRPVTVLGMFDYLGNGVIFDHKGKVRLKYNQTEGVVLDREIGPVSHWKWHSLNDPPVLQQVMIDTHMLHKDPRIMKLGPEFDKAPRKDNKDMMAIELENAVKEKKQKANEKFKPFQIKMKALKINENFSIRILDQASIHLLFRDGTTNLKLNIGMMLDSREIIDTDTEELGEISTGLEQLPAETDSVKEMQRNIHYAQYFDKSRTERERRLRPPCPPFSTDRFNTIMSKPLKPPLKGVNYVPSITDQNECRCIRKPSTCTLYYNNRLI